MSKPKRTFVIYNLSYNSSRDEFEKAVQHFLDLGVPYKVKDGEGKFLIVYQTGPGSDGEA